MAKKTVKALEFCIFDGAHCATYINESHLIFELQLPCDSCSVSFLDPPSFPDLESFEALHAEPMQPRGFVFHRQCFFFSDSANLQRTHY